MRPDFDAFDPARSVQWRWDRIEWLFPPDEQPLRPYRYDDGIVRQGWSFHRQYRRLREVAELEFAGTSRNPEEHPLLEALFAKMPGIWYAHSLFTGAGVLGRALIEASLLARDDDATIAQRLATIPEAVSWYEAIYFNVRDRLDARTWIAKFAIGGGAVNGVFQPTVDDACPRARFLRKLGYLAGPAELDAAIASWTEWGSFAGDFTSPQCIGMSSTGLKFWALYALDSEFITAEHAVRLVKLHVRSQRANPGTAGPGGDLTKSFADAIDAMEACW